MRVHKYTNKDLAEIVATRIYGFALKFEIPIGESDLQDLINSYREDFKKRSPLATTKILLNSFKKVKDDGNSGKTD